MSERALSCIVCDKGLSNVFPDVENQPSGGVHFSSYGNYGSTVFDEVDGSYLEINICDDCMKRASEQGKVMSARRVTTSRVEDQRLWKWDEEELR